MSRPSLSRFLESFALCISATAMVCTLTIAGNLAVILVDGWPGLQLTAPQRAELTIDAPKTSKPAVRPSRKRRPARVASAASVPKTLPGVARPAGAEEITLPQTER